MEKKKTILIIEQEANLAEGLKTILTKEGYGVISILTPYYLKELCKDKKPDLAIIDLHIPNELGHNILRKIKEFFPTLPVITMSVYSNSFTKKELNMMGVSDFIAKPFEVEYLKEKIEAFIGRKK